MIIDGCFLKVIGWYVITTNNNKHVYSALSNASSLQIHENSSVKNIEKYCE